MIARLKTRWHDYVKGVLFRSMYGGRISWWQRIFVDKEVRNRMKVLRSMRHPLADSFYHFNMDDLERRVFAREVLKGATFAQMYGSGRQPSEPELQDWPLVGE